MGTGQRHRDSKNPEATQRYTLTVNLLSNKDKKRNLPVDLLPSKDERKPQARAEKKHPTDRCDPQQVQVEANWPFDKTETTGKL